MAVAQDLIVFLHQVQYRAIPLKHSVEFLSEYRKSKLVKRFFYHLFKGSFNTKVELESFTVDENIDFLSEDYSDTIQERFRTVCKTLSIDCLYNVPLACEEAVFYWRLFNQCLFGLSYYVVKRGLFERDFIPYLVRFRKPYYFRRLELEDTSFPLIGQPNIRGFKFKAKISSEKYEVLRIDNRDLTHKFSIFKKLIPLLPKCRVSIDFILEPRQYSYLDMIELNDMLLNTSNGLHDCRIIVLDMYFFHDEAPTIERLQRIKKFVARCKKKDIKGIKCVPFKILNTQDEVDHYVKTRRMKHGACFIKENGTYNSDMYKTIKQFNSETMIVHDYTLQKTGKHDFKIQMLTCKTHSNETVYISNISKPVLDNVFNLIRKPVEVKWAFDKNEGFYPIAEHINLPKICEV